MDYNYLKNIPIEARKKLQAAGDLLEPKIKRFWKNIYKKLIEEYNTNNTNNTKKVPFKDLNTNLNTIITNIAQHDVIQSLAAYLDKELFELEPSEFANLVYKTYNTSRDINTKTLKEQLKNTRDERRNKKIENTISSPEKDKEIFTQEFDKIGKLKKVKSTNTPITNAFLNHVGKEEIVNAGKLQITTFGKTTIIVNATLENSKDLHIKGGTFTEIDRAINDICTTYREKALNEGKNSISVTPDQIYRSLTGKSSKSSVSPTQRQMVIDSIEKQSKHLHLWADLTDEMRVRNIITNPKGITQDEKYECIIDDFLIRCRTIRNRKGSILGWVFDSDSPGTIYAKLTNQILTIPTKMLYISVKNADGSTSPIPYNTIRVAIITYLTRRIEIIKHDETKAKKKLNIYNQRKNKDMPNKKIENFRIQSHTILFETIFKAAKIENKNTKTNSKEFIIQALKYWKSDNDIVDYKLRKKGKTHDAIIITP